MDLSNEASACASPKDFWLCGRPLEPTDRVTLIPKSGLTVHTSCHQTERELADDDQTDRRFGMDDEDSVRL